MGACGIYKQPYGEKAQFYINGKLVNENTLDGSYVDALTDLLIGNHKNATEKRVSKDIWMKCVIIKSDDTGTDPEYLRGLF